MKVVTTYTVFSRGVGNLVDRLMQHCVKVLLILIYNCIFDALHVPTISHLAYSVQYLEWPDL